MQEETGTHRRFRRWWLAVLGVVVVAGGGLYVYAESTDPVSTFCTADGYLGPNGEMMPYTRDHNQGCKWVDEDGDLLPGQ